METSGNLDQDATRLPNFQMLKLSTIRIAEAPLLTTSNYGENKLFTTLCYLNTNKSFPCLCFEI